MSAIINDRRQESVIVQLLLRRALALGGFKKTLSTTSIQSLYPAVSVFRGIVLFNVVSTCVTPFLFAGPSHFFFYNGDLFLKSSRRGISRGDMCIYRQRSPIEQLVPSASLFKFLKYKWRILKNMPPS